MRPSEEFERLRDELQHWRTRVDELRVRAHLGSMEFRDKLEETGDTLEPVARSAARRLEQLGRNGAEEVRSVVRSLRAGWDEVRRTHRELARDAERARRQEADARRHG